MEKYYWKRHGSSESLTELETTDALYKKDVSLQLPSSVFVSGATRVTLVSP